MVQNRVTLWKQFPWNRSRSTADKSGNSFLNRLIQSDGGNSNPLQKDGHGGGVGFSRLSLLLFEPRPLFGVKLAAPRPVDTLQLMPLQSISISLSPWTSPQARFTVRKCKARQSAPSPVFLQLYPCNHPLPIVPKLRIPKSAMASSPPPPPLQ